MRQNDKNIMNNENLWNDFMQELRKASYQQKQKDQMINKQLVYGLGNDLNGWGPDEEEIDEMMAYPSFDRIESAFNDFMNRMLHQIYDTDPFQTDGMDSFFGRRVWSSILHAAYTFQCVLHLRPIQEFEFKTLLAAYFRWQVHHPKSKPVECMTIDLHYQDNRKKIAKIVRETEKQVDNNIRKL